MKKEFIISGDELIELEMASPLVASAMLNQFLREQGIPVNGQYLFSGVTSGVLKERRLKSGIKITWSHK